MSRKQSDTCELFCYNKAKVNTLKKSMLSDDRINKLTEIFNVLGDNTRTKMILALSGEELCVCDLAHILDLSLSAVSHQLRLLRSLKLVKFRSAGKMAFYTLKDKHIIRLVKEGIRLSK